MMNFLSEYLVQIQGIIGAALVFYFNCRRFGKPTAQLNFNAAGEVEGTGSGIPLPVGSNTTRYKFVLYGSAYGLLGAVFYAVVYLVPSVAEQVKQVLMAFGAAENIAVLITMQGPILKAFIVGLLLPELPPFKTIEQEVRNQFYRFALIPAQQRSLSTRLKRADFGVNSKSLKKVTQSLVADHFDAADIVYENSASTRPLWTNATVLMCELEGWEASDTQRYKQAFEVLKVTENDERCIDRLRADFKDTRERALLCLGI